MKYYIKRDTNEYGPYALADLQRYVASGNILTTDLARSEGLADWVPVAQVLGNIPVPAPPTQGTVYGGAPAGGTVYGGTPGGGLVYGGMPGYGVAAAPVGGPMPPDFHWALVLVLTIFTCTLFHTVWLIVEAAWVRKIVPTSRGLLFILLSIAGYLVGIFFNEFNRVITQGQANPLGGLFSLAAIALQIVGAFTLRSDLEDYYNTTENIGLRLSGVMTFFFPVYYFQHHFSRIAEWKKTGILQPQG